MTSYKRYWNFTLTYKGREKALLAIGRAAGFKYDQWENLPPNLKRQLTKHFEAANANRD